MDNACGPMIGNSSVAQSRVRVWLGPANLSMPFASLCGAHTPCQNSRLAPRSAERGAKRAIRLSADRSGDLGARGKAPRCSPG